jgi:hypothetical protein
MTGEESLEAAAWAAGDLKDTSIRAGESLGEIGGFSFSDLGDMTGGVTAFVVEPGSQEERTVFSLDVDGMRLEDLERVFLVLRLGRKADRALREALALAAYYDDEGAP